MPPESRTTPAPPLNRQLLRQAGEYVGTLAEEAHTRFLLEPHGWANAPRAHRKHAEWMHLSKLSTDLLELANA